MRSAELDGKNGPHKGVRPTNVPLELWHACMTTAGDIDPHLFMRLHTDISLNEMYDILEMQEAMESWKHANHMNARHDDG